ncbi:MAG TPA: glycosyltransferase family 2 protein [Candidatus Hydrogenedentes bacterium]|nr:glycosyltransferase family 2 protein [Candidatus Hydrogenedentota bacterium]HPG67343.1 glycosyltransferase family 2 protein [Candidatus Hydrogenedentota bacterium]
MRIDFVIPVFNERDSLERLVAGITEHVGPHLHRIVLVDDGSTDGSFEVICRLREAYDTVDAIRFRRNFGKSAALAAGFGHADGDVVFTMDADLQDDPKEIPRFLEKIEEGFDVVSGWKRVRHDPWHKTMPSQVFNGGIARIFGLDLHDVNCGFKAYRREVVKAIRVYGERHRLLPVLAQERGYRIGEIEVEHHARAFGRSKYGFERFARGAMDVLSVWFLRRYRHSPGHFFAGIGMASASLGVLALLIAAVLALAGHPLKAGALMAAGMIAGVGGWVSVGLGLLAELVVERAPFDVAMCIAEEHVGASERE